MQAPPPAPGYAPPKKQSYAWLWILLGVFAVCGCGGIAVFGAILLPVFREARLAAIRVTCLSHVKSAALATVMYANDNDDRLPSSAAWIDGAERYAKRTEDFVCPALRRGPNPGSYGFAANDACSGLKTSAARAGAPKVWLYETSNLVRNAHGNPDLEAPPNRHGQGRSEAYTDGSAHFRRTASGSNSPQD